MNNKYLKVLTGLLVADIIFTFYGVGSCGATELNPLAINFYEFMLVKIIFTLFGIYILYMLKDELYQKPFIVILLIIYGNATLSNVYQYINWCIS